MENNRKVAAVTGASRGIGAATALALADEGFAVAVLYQTNQAGADACVQSILTNGGQARAYRVDVTDSAAVAAVTAQIEREMGAVSVLVNNAGISEQKLFTEITDSDWERMLAVHLDGAFYMTRAFLPAMLHEKYGRIINIASMWGETGGSCEVHYSAAKAGLIGLTKALAKELAPSGITVNAVSPGAVDTDMMRMLGTEICKSVAEETPVGRLARPEEIADAVCFLANEKAAYITGQVLSVNGGAVI
ncbi:MAG: elongation factor P 5-aminopentanone reductase [Candidatus Fimenecus sp.]